MTSTTSKFVIHFRAERPGKCGLTFARVVVVEEQP